MRTILALVAVGMLWGCGGGGGFSCSDKGKCPNDPATTSADISACNTAIAGSCGTEYKALGSCAESTQKCDSTGKTDTNSFISSCSVQLAALSNCCNAHPGTGGC